jgi:exonuclease 3'-5' domain-containing protein 1
LQWHITQNQTMTTVTFVATTTELSSLLIIIKDLPTSPPSLYIDLEGEKLSRNGRISLLTLYALPINTVYLIDIHALGAAAFTTPAHTISTTAANEEPSSAKLTPTLEPIVTLKSILESPTIPKVFFDVRNDSDALFAPLRHLPALHPRPATHGPRHHHTLLAEIPHRPSQMH